MKQTRKLIAILLALVMALTAVCVSAFAAQKKQYEAYTFFGDSVTTGFGITSYFDVAEEGGTAEGMRVPGAYPDLVAKGVGIDEDNENYFNEAHSGWRTSELRETLDPSYNNEDGAFAKALSQGMANGKTLADPQDPALQQRVRNEIAQSDIITIDLGSNDLQLPVLAALFSIVYPQVAAYFGIEEYKEWKIEQLLKEYDSTSEAILKLTEAVAKIHGAEYAMKILAEQSLGGLRKFTQNYPAIINLIREINPDADIYVIGLYNPMSEANLSDTIPLPVGKALDPVILSMNLYLATLCPARSQYTYVDAFNTAVLGTISLTAFVGEDMNLAGMGDYTMYIHPSEKGHAYIAEQVLKAIPDEEEAPAEEPAQEPAQEDTSLVVKIVDGQMIAVRGADSTTKASDYTGIAPELNNRKVWWRVVNGDVVPDATGVFRNEYGWWRVEDGIVDFTANGIYKNEYGWWKTTNGKVTFDETGIYKNEYGWWRTVDSKVDFNANGVYKNEYGWWKCTDGKVTFKETGIFKNRYGKWYCKNSKVDFSKNGKVTYGGHVYTVENGKVVG